MLEIIAYFTLPPAWGGGNKLIMNGLYLSAGAKVFKEVNIGENVTIAPNSLVTHQCEESNVTLAGCPAKVVREGTLPWWQRDGKTFIHRHDRVEELRKAMNIL